MALESFYGGKPGYSPVIKGTFKYISKNDSRLREYTPEQLEAKKYEIMDECFQDPTYKDIWYGELCIISSDSMYDANNGKIFRRTLKKQSSDDTYGTLYAEYLGQIVGMPGGLPKVVFNTIDKVKQEAAYATEGGYERWYPIGFDTNSGIVETSNESVSDISSVSTLNGSQGIEFVPGRGEYDVENNTYNWNDNLEYTWVQVLKPEADGEESDGTAATLNLGLKIPYMYFDAPDIESISYTKDAKVSEVNLNNHPFYKKYKFSIPDGVRGIGIKNLRLESKRKLNIINSNDKVLDPSKPLFKWDQNKQNIIVVIEDETTNNSYYYNFPNGYDEDRQFWVYDLIVPNRNDDTLNPNSVYICYAGDYEGIKNVGLDNDGSIYFQKEDGSDITFDQKIKWIDSITLDSNPTITNGQNEEQENPNYGNLNIAFNTGIEDSLNWTLPLVKKIIVSPNTTQNKGEKINVELINNNNSPRNLTLQKSVINQNNETTYEDYLLKYPTQLIIRGPKENDISESSQYYYLDAIYNDNSVVKLGPVGLQNITTLGADIGLKTTNGNNTIDANTYYLPETFRNDALKFIIEDIGLFNDLIDNNTFPSFTVTTTTT